MHNDFPWLGFIFWAGVFGWLAIAAWMRYLGERERQKTLRAFAERGQPLDKETIEKLFPARVWRQPQDPMATEPARVARGLVVGGLVCLFAGVGILIGAQLIGRIEPEALYGMSTGGVITCCVGLGLIAGSWALRRMVARERQDDAPGDGGQ